MTVSLGVALPGTCITSIIEKAVDETEQRVKEGDLPVVKLGSGLVQAGEDILAIKAGVLKYAKPNRFWIEGRQKRYVPSANDLVLGIITSRLSESYKVDIGCNLQATLNFAGFEGTTKKNRPNLTIGDLVFARVSIANKDLEPELVCLDTDNKSEGFGEIKQGMLFYCDSSYSQSLQAPDNWILETLGKHFAYEIIIGANGRFVVNSLKNHDIIKISDIILKAKNQDEKWLLGRIKEYMQAR